MRMITRLITIEEILTANQNDAVTPIAFPMPKGSKLIDFITDPSQLHSGINVVMEVPDDVITITGDVITPSFKEIVILEVMVVVGFGSFNSAEWSYKGNCLISSEGRADFVYLMFKQPHLEEPMPEPGQDRPFLRIASQD